MKQISGFPTTIIFGAGALFTVILGKIGFVGNQLIQTNANKRNTSLDLRMFWFFFVCVCLFGGVSFLLLCLSFGEAGTCLQSY